MADEPKNQNGGPDPGGEEDRGQRSLKDVVRENPGIQSEINRVVEERIVRERKRFQSALEELAGERGHGADELLSRLRDRLTSLEEASLSAEERLKRSAARVAEQKDREIGALREQLTRTRESHRRSVIERALTDAAARCGAYRADQIVRLLASDARLEEESDPDTGEGTGRYSVKLRQTEQGGDGPGQEAWVDLEEGVERYLLENPNLRRPERPAGTGSAGAAFVPDRLTPDSLGHLTLSELKKRRKELEALAKGKHGS